MLIRKWESDMRITLNEKYSKKKKLWNFSANNDNGDSNTLHFVYLVVLKFFWNQCIKVLC